MTTLPERAAVIGTGGGGLTIAAELSLRGVNVTLTDLPRFSEGLKAVAAGGGVKVTFRKEGGEQFTPVAGTSDDPQTAIGDASLIIVSVPCYGHRPFAELLAPALQDGQTIIWAGEGGGSFTTIAALRELERRPEVILADTNSLPYAGAYVQEPGTVIATRKSGGTYVAALPAAATGEIYEITAELWPWIKPAQNVWETLLVNFNAIDHVAPMIGNLAPVENRRDRMKLWGEGLSPGVGRLIAAVDDEYAALRGALGLKVEKKYQDYLVEQGLVERKQGSVYETMKTSDLLMSVEFDCGPDALQHRFISEDVPYALVLASSLGDRVSVDTPVIDSLITIASIASEEDFWQEGRTLDSWGLGDANRDTLVQAVENGWW